MLETLKRSSSAMGVSVYGVCDNYKRRNVSSTREFPKDCGRCATRLNAKKVLGPLVSEHSKSLDQIELVSALDLGSIVKELHPRRRVSSVREYPIGWRHAKGDCHINHASYTSHQVKNQEIVLHTRNSLEYNSGQIICLDDEKDARRPPRSTMSVIPFGRLDSNNVDVVTRTKVRQTLCLSQGMFVPGTLFKRIDLVTVKELKKQEMWVNTGDEILGHVPGVEVGVEFHYRVELSIIGLHGPFLGGIDHVKKDGVYDDLIILMSWYTLVKTLVYECGPLCKCPPLCHNRVSQHGIKHQLEIFKTKPRGWGVRSLNSIPSGSFICEYKGELLAENEADQRTGNDEYPFDLGRSKNSNRSMGAGLSNVIPPDLQSISISWEMWKMRDLQSISISWEMWKMRGSPLMPLSMEVLVDLPTIDAPHNAICCCKLPSITRVEYDYNYVVDTVHDSVGHINIKVCYCGYVECTGRIHESILREM
ncbi:hypothetical protein MKX01_042376 [Papaver californicum]|nr:hypothetical protein MKX01_042376 [Papaver californicum]